MSLDNASSTAQVRHLLPESPSCFALVTSRDSLGGARHGAHRIELELLSLEDSVRSCVRLSAPGWSRIGSARDIAQRCARLPLARRVGAGGQLPNLISVAEAATAGGEWSVAPVLLSNSTSTVVRRILHQLGTPFRRRCLFAWPSNHPQSWIGRPEHRRSRGGLTIRSADRGAAGLRQPIDRPGWTELHEKA